MSMKNNALKLGAIAAAAAITASITAPIAGAGEETIKGAYVPASPGCDAVEVITVAGTGESNSNDDPQFIYGLKQGRNYTADIALERDEVGAWQTPYSATVGIANSINGNKGNLHVPYGESRLEGVQTTERHIADVKASCPDTKFVVTGYSQGASVAGDVAADMIAGKIPGVDADDLFAAYLLSDPNRAPATDEKTRTALGVPAHVGANGETIVDLNQGAPLGTEGLAGPRAAGAFAGTNGRVMSFCHPNDIACSTERDGILQRVGVAMNEIEHHDQHYVYAGVEGLQDVDLVKTFGVRLLPIFNAVYKGDPERTHKLVNEVASHPLNNMTKSQREAMRALAEELAIVAAAVRDFDGAVAPFEGIRLDNSVPAVVTMLARTVTFWDPQQKANLIDYITQMMPYHLSYFTKNDMAQTTYGPWTAGGMTVDEYIYQDLKARLNEAGVK
jgi:hypothetical protein